MMLIAMETFWRRRAGNPLQRKNEPVAAIVPKSPRSGSGSSRASGIRGVLTPSKTQLLNGSSHVFHTFNGPWTNMIHRHRYLVVVVFLLFAIGAVISIVQ